MSRPVLLLFLLIVMIITSQFEWRQQLVSDAAAANHTASQKQLQRSKREEVVKEKIILAQEKNIQKLNELIRSLREQLSECRSTNGTANSSLTNLTESIIELERQQFLED